MILDILFDLPDSVVSVDDLDDLDFNTVVVQGERVALIESVRVGGILKGVVWFQLFCFDCSLIAGTCLSLRRR
jgi:hypothetical protein